MGFSSKFRKGASSTTTSSTPSSQTSSAQTSPLSSRTNSSTNLPDLTTAPTVLSTKTTSFSSSKLSKSSSSSSSFKSLVRSVTGQKDPMDPMKYAPKKFKFRVADPRHVAILGAWDMSENWGASERRCSWQSGISPSGSRRNSICYAEHIEEA